MEEWTSIIHFENVQEPILDAILFVLRVSAMTHTLSSIPPASYDIRVVNKSWRRGKHFVVTARFDPNTQECYILVTKKSMLFAPKVYSAVILDRNVSRIFLETQGAWNRDWLPNERHDFLRDLLRRNLPKSDQLQDPRNMMYFSPHILKWHYDQLYHQHQRGDAQQKRRQSRSRSPSPKKRKSPSPQRRRASSRCEPIWVECERLGKKDRGACAHVLEQVGEWRHPQYGGEIDKYKEMNYCLRLKKDIFEEDEEEVPIRPAGGGASRRRSPPRSRRRSPPRSPRSRPADPCFPVKSACDELGLKDDPKKCFKKLTLVGEWRHPDRGGTKEKFQILNDCLGEKKDSAYDESWKK